MIGISSLVSTRSEPLLTTEVDRFFETACWERSLMVAVDCFRLLSSARSQSKPHQRSFLQAPGAVGLA